MTTKKANSTPHSIKDLSFVALFSLIFGSMVGSGVFDAPQNIAHSAGVIAVSIGWAITIIGVMSLSFALIYITRNRPDIQSGLYGYAKADFGNYMGFNAAWGYTLNAIIANTSYLILACATMGNFALFKFLGRGNNLASLIVESTLIWLVYFFVRHGIRNAAILNVVITMAKIVALIVIIVLFILAFHFKSLLANLHFEWQLGSMFTQVKSTMLVTVWNFTGVEAACVFAIRAKSMKDVAKATLLGAVLLCIIDAAISILPFGILPSEVIRQLPSPSTASILATVYSAMYADVIRGVVIMSVLGALLAWTMLITNMFYVVADDKSMPQCLTRMNVHNVPINSLLAGSLAVQFFILVAFCTHSMYLIMLELAASFMLLPYFLATLFAIKLIITEQKVDIIAFVKGSLAVLYSIWLVYAGGVRFLALSSALYFVGSLLYFKARREQQQKLFANRYELGLFLLFALITVVSIVICAYLECDFCKHHGYVHYAIARFETL